MIHSLISPRARLGLGTILLALLGFAASVYAEDRPLPGQLLIDPDHRAWLIRHPVKDEDKPQHIFLCGPGDPEDFLYRGHRRADGTRDGDQEQIIRKLIQHGGNCLYLQVVRSHGGDGQRDHNPFVDSDPAKDLDRDILDQWDGWFRLMDQHGIVIYLFLFDDSARIWGRKADKQLPPEERAFLTAIVDRFEKHANLIWVAAEECEEAFSMERVRAMAEVIAEADDHGHLIGTHHQSGTTFKAWESGGALSHFSMQYNKPGDAAHSGAVEAFRKARGKYQVIYAENTAREGDVKQAWASAMGGLMPMLLGLDVANTPPKTLNQCRYLSQFFEATDFYRMEPQDVLAQHGTKWLVGDGDRSYIAYAEAGNEPLGIKNLPAGQYELIWLDCENGRKVQVTATVKQANRTFARPAGIGGWCAVWVRRADRDKDARKPDSQPSESTSRTVFPDHSWETRLPSEVGLDAKALDEFAKAVAGDGVIIKDGSLVKSWGNADRRGDWASAAKPVLSTLMFFAIEEGKLKSVDDLVRPWVQKRWPGKDLIAKDRGMTFRHLADMTSGYARAEKPGTHWAYNDYAISLYRHVLEEVLGESLVKAARQRFEPLQFEDGDLFGSRDGGGVNASPRDFARVGWLWLNQGNWAGKQLLPKSYFEKHLRPDVPNDLPRTKAKGEDYLGVGTYGGGSDQNFPVPGVYGFNWWFNERLTTDGPRFAPHLPTDAFWALGHEGREVLLVLPSLRIVVAARGNWGGATLPKAKRLMQALQSKSTSR